MSTSQRHSTPDSMEILAAWGKRLGVGIVVLLVMALALIFIALAIVGYGIYRAGIWLSASLSGVSWTTIS